MSSNSEGTPQLRPLVARGGAVAVPLWEQPQFVLAVASVFEANRLDPEACRDRLREALMLAGSERRARWMSLVVESQGGIIADVVAARSHLVGTVGREVTSLGLPEDAFRGPQRLTRWPAALVAGEVRERMGADGELLLVPLYIGCERVGFLLAEVSPGQDAAVGWMQVFGDFLAWTLKGQRDGGARAGLGLPVSAAVVERDPGTRWMAAALDLIDHPIAVTDSPGVMNYVNAAALAFVTGVGVEDYATDLTPSAHDDVDEMTWRAQLMIAVAGARHGERPLMRRMMLVGDVVVNSDYDGRLVRHPVSGAIVRQIMMATHHAADPSEESTSGIVAGGSKAPRDRETSAHQIDVGDVGGLTRRQVEVAVWLCRGERAAEIAARLGVSVHTVRSHVRSLYASTGASRQHELIRALHDLGLETGR